MPPALQLSITMAVLCCGGAQRAYLVVLHNLAGHALEQVQGGAASPASEGGGEDPPTNLWEGRSQFWRRLLCYALAQHLQCSDDKPQP